ncbi:hypothetical protein HQ305_04525 [Rhodococcus sp. BP-149]|uniref:hypothetical protein n=1 Tax=unclassified Rhodococcus (in: high G+C Gram-positive bacteria) TaxID=192944 RepID=UPI001C9B4BDE|nr:MULTISPECIES: hypothetical protein [unclassified Rhodococcus (in: high G+C Gram-positive bacteria)]MBY6684435.1 hypothetical protein [Rhodococcus sp. BP-288]MBY6692904.1 hypothetical protein [Rhodococcus sp. BP-188]MBY6697101.1 hypothetical protein [Rhodococcus sp. BP-285]MBY6701778.1 hypothetical protein [Rhodococcus sp. BP-283]MBY6710289.1 hypothetical protein [Rhodococcus sp. BP-160]
MPQSEYPSTELDRTFASAQTLAVVGPTAGLDVDAARAMLAAAENASPTSRIRLDPRSDSRNWAYRTDIGAGTAVTSRPDLATDDLGELMDRVRTRDGVRAPVEIVLCGDYAVVHYSHGVGDGQLGVLLVGAAASDPGFAIARSMAPSLPRSATWSALRRHYRSNPRALQDFRRLRAVHKRRDATADGAPTRRIEHWESSKTTRAAYMRPEQVAELRSWSKANAPGATGASVSVALLVAALRSEGVPLDEHVMILFNCRRYLDEKHRAEHGNFAIGIPVRLPVLPTPGDVAGVMKQVIDSGWPIAVLGMADARATLKGHRTAPAPAPSEDVVTVPDRPRLAVSDLGTLSIYDHLPWLDDGRPRQMTASLEPDGPDGISILVSQVQGGRSYSASFCSGMIETETVDRALARACADPVGLLSRNTADLRSDGE